MNKREMQIQLEQLFSKNMLMPRIRREIEDTPVLLELCKAAGLDQKFGVDLMAQMALHKRASLQVLVGSLRHHAPTAQGVVDLIHRAAVGDLVDYTSDLDLFIVKYILPEHVQAELDRFQYPLPMVCEPVELTHNKMTGYLTTKGSIILRNNHHDGDVCLDHLNRMNKIKFKIDFNTANMIQNRWRNLDKPKDGESHEEFQDRRRAFEKYDRTARDVLEIMKAAGNEFNLTHRPDKRGRTYCQGYHVSYQGATWNKSVILFADEEIIE